MKRNAPDHSRMHCRCRDLYRHVGNITFLNPVAGSLVGWQMRDAVGRRLTEILRIVDATTRKPILDPMAKAASENLTGKIPLNSVLIQRDGHEVFIEDSVAPSTTVKARSLER